jgi:hypothetical protein
MGTKGQRRSVRRSAIGLALTSVLLAALGGSLFVTREKMGRSIEPQPAAAGQERPAATITLAKEGNRCRQLVLDNVTGRMSDNGLLPCDSALVGKTPTRIDSIRDSFKSR